MNDASGLSAESAELIFNALSFFANVTSYQGDRVGGVLQGCPRGPKPTPIELAGEARRVLNKVQDELRLVCASATTGAAPAEAYAWRDAKLAEIAALDAYNARVLYARQRDEVDGFGRTRVDAEFQAWTAASNTAHAALKAMIAPLFAALAAPTGAAPTITAPERELDDLLAAAAHALRSYQFGNDAPDLAKAMADKIVEFQEAAAAAGAVAYRFPNDLAAAWSRRLTEVVNNLNERQPLSAGFRPCGSTKGGLHALQLQPADMPEAMPALGSQSRLADLAEQEIVLKSNAFEP